jgi:hypothetical protein
MSRAHLWGSRRLNAAGPRSGLFACAAFVALLIVPAAGHSAGAAFKARGPLKRAAAGLLAVALFLTGLLSAAPAGAQPPPPPVPLPTPDPIELEGFCDGFTAVITFTTVDQRIIQETRSDGTTTLLITGHAQTTVTNKDTGESVTYNTSGPGTLVFYPDGAFSIDAAGPNLLWTAPENLANFPDVPTISYTTGHVTVEVDASGQTTSYTLAGGERQEDVCAVLAP